MITRICKHCGKEYRTYPSVNFYFCSYECNVNWKRGKTWIELYDNAEEMLANIKGVRKSPNTEFKRGWAETEEGKEMLARRHKIISSKKSRAEEIAIRIIHEQNLPFNFVGDGTILIGTKNPDFICKDGKKVIEIYSDYWHREDIAKYWHQTEEGGILYYEIHGYNALIIWENELKNPPKVIEKIKEFLNTSIEFDAPIKTKERFLELTEEFEGNRGMLVKHLIDFYDGLIPKGWEHLELQIAALANEIEALKANQKIEDPKAIRMANGKILNRS